MRLTKNQRKADSIRRCLTTKWWTRRSASRLIETWNTGWTTSWTPAKTAREKRSRLRRKARKNNRSLEERSPVLYWIVLSRKCWSRNTTKKWKLLAASWKHSKSSLRTADVSPRLEPLRDLSLSGDERGETSAVRRLSKEWQQWKAFVLWNVTQSLPLELFRLDLKRCCWSVLSYGYLTFPIYGNTMLSYEQQTRTTLFCALKSYFLGVKSFEFKDFLN